MNIGDRVRVFGSRRNRRRGVILDLNRREVYVLLDSPDRCRTSDVVTRRLWFQRDHVRVLSAPELLAELA